LEAVRHGEEGADARYEWSVIELLDQLVRHQSGGEMLRLWCSPDVPGEDFVAQRVGTEYWRARAHCKGHLLPARATTDARAVGGFRLSGEVHQWMYDCYSLRKLMIDCGFVQVRTCAPNESSIADFKGYCLDTNGDGSTYKPDSFFMEGRKPGYRT
jgi:hypothetical protein